MKRTRRIGFIAGGVLVLLVAAFLLLGQVDSKSAENAGDAQNQNAQSVRAVKVRLGDVQAWAFAEGTARGSALPV